MQNQSTFQLLPTHKFVLLGCAVCAAESQENHFRNSAMCAVTVPESYTELKDNGFLEFTGPDPMIPVLTSKGQAVVNSMLSTRVAVPHKPQHFKAVTDGHLLQLADNTLKAIKSRVQNSAKFAEKASNSEELAAAAANLEFLTVPV